MILRHALLATTVALALIPEAQAQLVGNEGWSYQAANRSFHAQGQLLRRQYSASGASSASSAGGGAGGLAVYNSTTIGNIDQISQTLGDGANAYLNTNTTQTNTGSQTSTSTGGGNGGPATSTNTASSTNTTTSKTTNRSTGTQATGGAR